MRRTLLLLLLVVFLASASVVAAQSGFSLVRHVFGGGGGASMSGRYGLDNTVAQPMAGVLQGGNYRIDVGFWVPDDVTTIYYVYLPLILHNQ